MKPFLETVFENDQRQLIDWHSPDEQAMEREGDDDEKDAEEITVDGIQGIPRDALRRLVLFLIPQKSISSKKKWQIATYRLALVSQLLDVDGAGGQTFESLAQELGCTRALLSLYSLRMVDGLGMNKAPAGKTRASREVFRQSAIASHQARGHRMKSTQEAL